MSGGRSQGAYLLARRVERQARGPSAAARWAGLVAIWVHLVAAAMSELVVRPEPLPPDVGYIEVVRTTEPIGSTGPSAPVGAQPADASPEVPPPADADVAAAARLRDPPPVPPPAPHPVDPLDAERFARTERGDRTPVEADAISAHDTERDRPASRSPVTADRDGALTPVADGALDRSARPTLDRRDGDLDAAPGNRDHGDPGPFVVGGGGGEPPAPLAGDARGSPTRGGGLASGGAMAAGAPASAPGGALAGSQAPAAITAPTGPDPSLTTSAPTPAWWAPMATRVAMSAGGVSLTPSAVPSQGDAVVQVVAPPAPVAKAAHAPIDRDGHGSDVGGTDGTAASPSARVATDPAPERGTRRIAAPGTADPVDELREALGFGPLDRAKLAPRPAWAGLQYDQGARESSPQVALDLPIQWQSALSTRGTARGAYIQQAEETIASLWRSADLDPHSRAIGVQGDVTVRYRIGPDGRTSEAAVVRSSGNAALDRMALDAIPARLPRFPRELGRTPFYHQVTLRYLNRFVSP